MDEEYKIKVIDNYQNKLEEISVYNNLIEQITKKINNNSEELLLIKEDYKISKRDLFFGVIISLFWFIKGIPFILTPNCSIIEIILTSLFSLIILGGMALFFDIIINNKKRIKGLEKEQTFLKKQLIDSREYLKELVSKQDKLILDENLKLKRIDNSKALSNLRNNSYLYYDCGFNEKKYIRYYNHNSLYDKLRDRYSDEYIGEVVNYLEENNKVKKKIKK